MSKLESEVLKNEVETLEINPTVFTERCKVDHELITKLVLNRDIKNVLKEEGFDLPENFYVYVEKSIKKIRDYITDQIHGLEVKDMQIRNVVPANSGNGAVDW